MAKREKKPVEIVERPFYLDTKQGTVEVIVRGPAGAVKLMSTETSLTISTGEAPIAAPVSSRAVAQPREATTPAPRRAPAPRKIHCIPAAEDGNPDYVPPPVVEAVRKERQEMTAEQLEAEIDAARPGGWREESEEGDVVEPEAPTRASTAPKSTRDRTAAQRSALKINTTMQTSLGESRVELDLTPQLRSMSH